jgi:hypothetical protein
LKTVWTMRASTVYPVHDQFDTIGNNGKKKER